MAEQKNMAVPPVIGPPVPLLSAGEAAPIPLVEGAGLLWTVIGGSANGGIVVRDGEDLESPKLATKLQVGARVQELVRSGNRLLYSKVNGEGPHTGWVSFRVKNTEMLRLEKDSSSSESSDGASKRSVFSRLILGPRGVPEPLKTQQQFDQVFVFGPMHAATNNMCRELRRFFNVTVKNEHFADNPRYWKHRIFGIQPFPENAFCVCMVKEPGFWIQSLARDLVFYEMFPMVWTGVRYCPVRPSSSDQLFSHVWMPSGKWLPGDGPGNIFCDAVAVWEHTVRAYFDEKTFPSAQTAVVRSEDMLFNFSSVIRALALRGLPWREDAPTTIQPLDTSAKDASHPGSTRRDRPKLLKEYGDMHRRYRGLVPKQVERLQRIDPMLIGQLHYGKNAVAEWTRSAQEPTIQ